MIDIEELSIKLSQCHSFRQYIRSQARQCIQASVDENSEDKDIPLAQLSRQIAGQLSQITQLVLEEENSSNFMTLMRNNQEMCTAIQKRIQLEFQAKLYALNKRIEQLNTNIQSLNTKIQQLTSKIQQPSINTQLNDLNTDTDVLKQQRKIVISNILNSSRFVTNAKTQSALTPRNLKQPSFDYCEFAANSKQAILTNDSRSRASQKDNNCSDLDSLENHPILHKLKTKIEQTTHRTSKIEESLGSMSQKVDIKLDNCLQGLWNVLGDLNARVAKIQSKLLQTDGRIDLYYE